VVDSPLTVACLHGPVPGPLFPDCSHRVTIIDRVFRFLLGLETGEPNDPCRFR
jgi:hypothetical protein